MTTENGTGRTSPKSPAKTRRGGASKSVRTNAPAEEAVKPEAASVQPELPLAAAPAPRKSRPRAAKPRSPAVKPEVAGKAASKTKASKAKLPKPAAAEASVAKPVKSSRGGAQVRIRAVKAKVAAPANVQVKVVRDGFTMPKNEYEAIKTLKASCLRKGVAVKKSELLRAGLKLLTGLKVEELLAAIMVLPVVKTGRKKKD